MEIFRPAYGEKAAAGVSVRTMNYLCFLNTKTLFKYMRYDAALGAAASHTPVTAHVNYHPEKEARMVSIIQFYFHGDGNALNRWNGGEGTILGTQCKAELQRYQVGGVLSMDRCVGPSQYCARCASWPRPYAHRRCSRSWRKVWHVAKSTGCSSST